MAHWLRTVERLLFTASLFLVPAPSFAQQDLLTTLLGVGASVLAEENRRQQLLEQPAPDIAVADPDVRLVQQRLNDLGYDAGPPDGVMGAKTRRALADYQRASGKVPTGELDDADRAALTGTTNVAQAPAASTGFSVLYDIDLPYNDFRSGISERGLKGIGMDGCLAACSADSRCQAFTYNVSARVCFLKTSGGNPTPFNGAVSGVRNGGGGIAAPATAERLLTPAEIAQLQAGLNARGYDAGEPDGVAGARTRAAIARFVADHPGASSSAMTTGLMRAVLQQPGQVEAAPLEASAYRSFDDQERA
ncbi:MAG: hypothetical protein EOP19_06555, partial [Hyphomicrobiales bacterium]